MDKGVPSNKTSELYDIFPFLEAFPFDEYEIVLEELGEEDNSGISQILIQNLGSSETDYRVNFYYQENESQIMVSFYQEDIEYLLLISEMIKKLDQVVENLTIGIKSVDIKTKISNIKKGNRFIKGLDSTNFYTPPFESVLQDMMKLDEVTLTSTQVLGIHKLDQAMIEKHSLNKKEKSVVLSYFNFKLHYAKILLGIVISAKIY